MREQEWVIDLDDKAQKLRMLSRLGALSGKWAMSIRPHKPKRSLPANAFYWVAVIPAFREFLRSHGSYFTPEECHEFLLQTHSRREVVDPLTGEVMAVIGNRSSNMDSAQFSEYVNRCIEWLGYRFGVLVPDPNCYGAEQASARH